MQTIESNVESVHLLELLIWRKATHQIMRTRWNLRSNFIPPERVFSVVCFECHIKNTCMIRRWYTTAFKIQFTYHICHKNMQISLTTDIHKRWLYSRGVSVCCHYTTFVMFCWNPLFVSLMYQSHIIFDIPIINNANMLLLIYRQVQMSCHNKLPINWYFNLAKWARSLIFYNHGHIFYLSLKWVWYLKQMHLWYWNYAFFSLASILD